MHGIHGRNGRAGPYGANWGRGSHGVLGTHRNGRQFRFNGPVWDDRHARPNGRDWNAGASGSNWMHRAFRSTRNARIGVNNPWSDWTSRGEWCHWRDGLYGPLGLCRAHWNGRIG